MEDALELTTAAENTELKDSRTSKNTRHTLTALLRQSAYSRLVKYEDTKKRSFRGDAVFAKPELYEFLEAEGYRYAIRLPANHVLHTEISYLLTRPVSRPPKKSIVYFTCFEYLAATWTKPLRVVANVEWHRGELYPVSASSSLI